MRESSTAKLRKVTDQAEVTTTLRKSVLSGAFANISSAEWRTPPFKLIPFISSTFTDTGHERDFLQDLLLEMRAEARKEGEPWHLKVFIWFHLTRFLSTDIQVIFVDMRWGVRDENTSDHMTWIACSR